MFALGHPDLPATVRVGSVPYALERIVKHDFWAGTGFYVRPPAVLRSSGARLPTR